MSGTAAVVSLALALLSGSAHAEQWFAEEPAGDVRTSTHAPDPEPCGTTTTVDSPDDTTTDITKLAVAHGGDSLRVAVRFRDLVSEGRQVVTAAIKTADRFYLAYVQHSRAGIQVELFTAVPGHPKPDECGGVTLLGWASCAHWHTRWEADRDVVRMRLPRTCLDEPEWVRVSASSTSPRHGANSSDAWAPEGVPEGGFWGPFGPRVLAG